MWEQAIGEYAVRFREQGDEFAFHISVELTGYELMSARGSDGTSPVELGPRADGPVASRLIVRPGEDGVSCTVVGDGGSATAEEVEPWRRATRTAAAALGQRDPRLRVGSDHRDG